MCFDFFSWCLWITRATVLKLPNAFKRRWRVLLAITNITTFNEVRSGREVIVCFVKIVGIELVN